MPKNTGISSQLECTEMSCPDLSEDERIIVELNELALCMLGVAVCGLALYFAFLFGTVDRLARVRRLPEGPGEVGAQDG